MLWQRQARGDVAVRALQAEAAELPSAPEKDQSEPARIALEPARLAEALAERQSLARLKVLSADLDAQIRAKQRAQTLTRGPSNLVPATCWKGMPEIAALIERRITVMAQSAALPGRAEAMCAGALVMAAALPAVLLAWLGAARGLARIEAPIGLAYGSNLTRVTAVLMEVARAHPAVLADPAPDVLMTGTGASSLDLELRVFVPDIAHGVIVRSDLYLALVPALAGAGITIPFPVIGLHLPKDMAPQTPAPETLPPETPVPKRPSRS